MESRRVQDEQEATQGSEPQKLDTMHMGYKCSIMESRRVQDEQEATQGSVAVDAAALWR